MWVKAGPTLLADSSGAAVVADLREGVRHTLPRRLERVRDEDPLYAVADIVASTALDYGLIVGQTGADDPALPNRRWPIEVAQATALVEAFMA